MATTPDGCRCLSCRASIPPSTSHTAAAAHLPGQALAALTPQCSSSSAHVRGWIWQLSPTQGGEAVGCCRRLRWRWSLSPDPAHKLVNWAMVLEDRILPWNVPSSHRSQLGSWAELPLAMLAGMAAALGPHISATLWMGYHRQRCQGGSHTSQKLFRLLTLKTEGMWCFQQLPPLHPHYKSTEQLQ